MTPRHWKQVSRNPCRRSYAGPRPFGCMPPALFELNVSPELLMTICIHRRCLDTRWRGVAIRQESQNRETSELHEKLSPTDHIA
jgi:hypothetical protein